MFGKQIPRNDPWFPSCQIRAASVHRIAPLRATTQPPDQPVQRLASTSTPVETADIVCGARFYRVEPGQQFLEAPESSVGFVANFVPARLNWRYFPHCPCACRRQRDRKCEVTKGHVRSARLTVSSLTSSPPSKSPNESAGMGTAGAGSPLRIWLLRCWR